MHVESIIIITFAIAFDPKSTRSHSLLRLIAFLLLYINEIIARDVISLFFTVAFFLGLALRSGIVIHALARSWNCYPSS